MESIRQFCLTNDLKYSHNVFVPNFIKKCSSPRTVCRGKLFTASHMLFESAVLFSVRTSLEKIHRCQSCGSTLRMLHMTSADRRHVTKTKCALEKDTYRHLTSSFYSDHITCNSRESSRWLTVFPSSLTVWKS